VVSDDGHTERQAKDRVGRNAEGVEGLPAEQESEEVHHAPEEADDGAEDHEEDPVALEARRRHPVGPNEMHKPGDQVALEVDDEEGIDGAGLGGEPPGGVAHSRHEETRRAEREKGRRQRVRGDQCRPSALSIEEREHVVIEEDRDRDDAEVEKPLPGQGRAGLAGRTKAEYPEIPDGQPRREPGEHAVLAALAAWGERAP